MTAESLSREQRDMLAEGACSGLSGMTAAAVDRLVSQYEATVRAETARADVERERAEALRAEMFDAMMHCPKCDWPDLVPGCHPCQILSDALAADDLRRAGQPAESGEGEA